MTSQLRISSVDSSTCADREHGAYQQKLWNFRTDIKAVPGVKAQKWLAAQSTIKARG